MKLFDFNALLYIIASCFTGNKMWIINLIYKQFLPIFIK